MDINYDFFKSVLNYCPDTGIFSYKIKRSKCNPGERAGWVHVSGYRYIGFEGRAYKEHRLAWLYFYGNWPEGDIDHINGKQDDNRISNLRVVDDSLNSHNKKWNVVNNRSGFRGVSRHKSERGKPKWRVRITIGGNRVSIGNFNSLESAIKARIEAENKHYGDYAPSMGCMKNREIDRTVCMMDPKNGQ